MLSTLAFLQNLGGFELVLICVVALVVFGNKFPEVARNVGRAFQQFKGGIQEASSQVKRELEQAAAEADPTPEIKAAVGEAMADDDPTSDDYSTDDEDYNYDYEDAEHAEGGSLDDGMMDDPETAESSGDPSESGDSTSEGRKDVDQTGSSSDSDEDMSQSMITGDDPVEESTDVPAETAATASESGPSEQDAGADAQPSSKEPTQNTDSSGDAKTPPATKKSNDAALLN